MTYEASGAGTAEPAVIRAARVIHSGRHPLQSDELPVGPASAVTRTR